MYVHAITSINLLKSVILFYDFFHYWFKHTNPYLVTNPPIQPIMASGVDITVLRLCYSGTFPIIMCTQFDLSLHYRITLPHGNANLNDNNSQDNAKMMDILIPKSIHPKRRSHW